VFVLLALERFDWNQSRAARELGVHRNTLIARVHTWNIRCDQPLTTIRPLGGDCADRTPTGLRSHLARRPSSSLNPDPLHRPADRGRPVSAP
jgi:hypothetical protein